MKIQESRENYLETILNLEQKNGVVRSIDIATELGFSKPSVSRAMSVLKKAGLIDQESYGTIRLTEAGRKRAQEVYDRHQLLTRFFTKVLQIDADIAEQDACRTEHVVSMQTIAQIRKMLEQYEANHL